METVVYYFMIFFIYSVLGWIMESTYVSILEKKLIDRGFLIGPYCPIYGYGSLIVVTYLMQYKDNCLTVFIMTVFMCCVLEYLTSYFMEKIFKARWWDYSNKPFNLNGRICGRNAILFGFGGLVIVYIIQPIVDIFLNKIDFKILLILSIIFFVIFLIDTIVSFNVIHKLKNTIVKEDTLKDSTQELKALVSKAINANLNSFRINILQRRLIKAYPHADIKNWVKKSEEQIKKVKKLLKK